MYAERTVVLAMANRETGLLKKDAAATASRTYIFHPKCHQLRYLCLHLHRTAIPPPALLQEILAPELQLHRFSFVTSHQILLRIVPEYLSIRPHYLGLSFPSFTYRPPPVACSALAQHSPAPVRFKTRAIDRQRTSSPGTTKVQLPKNCDSLCAVPRSKVSIQQLRTASRLGSSLS
ncbi:hypothetical protein HDV57DRAFT_296577 [Trichoderma longibrachiatum]|uniref:Uncharacterized protein n=1 Tax=Trichoderma longibrachiatum ATCC 18648 TaxID=983965 RepID=A0A2T4CCS6_TRILO|nr:hypothetical protein M440DRAFT_1166975 [Trichoderma longibrachiatum ATCC 18648]